MKVAIVQMESTNALDKNLEKMEFFLKQGSAQKADLILFPEMCYFTGSKESWLPLLPRFEEFKSLFVSWAKRYAIAIVPGTLREPVTTGAERYYNHLLFIEPSGKTVSYRKIFLYQANLPDRVYEEGKYCQSGTEIVTHEWGGITFGFSVCFDLRFPELFRSLKKRGAQAALMPSAFTVPTGKAHWETLVRARAIENQFFLIAPDLTGVMGDGAKTYGHSLCVNPWGEAISHFSTEEGLKLASIDTNEIKHVASKVAAWQSINEKIFPIA